VKRLFACAALAAAVSLSACAGVPGLNLQSLVSATTDDLKQADADAGAIFPDGRMHDPIAHQCYAAALDFVAAQQGGSILPPQMPVGAISAFQNARDAVKATAMSGGGGAGPVPEPLILACGPLALDAENDIAHLTSSFVMFGLHF
jgi:hypothetical protein